MDLLYRSGECNEDDQSHLFYVPACKDTKEIGCEIIVDSFLERSTCIEDTANSPSGCHVEHHVTCELARQSRKGEEEKRMCRQRFIVYKPIKCSDAAAAENVSMTKEIAVPSRSLTRILLVKGFVFFLL